MMRTNEIDWIGRWYVVAAERGVNTENTFGRVDVATGETEWFLFNHSEMDGAGGMAAFMRKLGFRIDTLPKGRVVRPSWWQVTGILWRALRQMGPSRVPWREQNPRSIPPPTKVAWIYFSKDETARIQSYVKRRHLSENSFLLSLLCEVALPELVEGDGGGRFLFPVNMRGPIVRQNELANQSSSIFVSASKNSTAEELHGQIKQKFLSHEHWGVWWAFSVGRWVGMDMMRILSRRSEQRAFFLGTFSNMGAWPPPECVASRAQNENEVIFAAAPGTPNYPIGMVCLTWQGKLAISLKFDPTICADREKPARVLQQIKERVLGVIGG